VSQEFKICHKRAKLVRTDFEAPPHGTPKHELHYVCMDLYMVWYVVRAVEANIVHIYDCNVCYIREGPLFRVELPVFIFEKLNH